MTVMRQIRPGLAAALALAGLALAVGTASPAPRAVTHVRPGTSTASADAQLIAALRTRIGAARAREAAILAAVEQRLRAIYASPMQDPLTILLTGDVTGARALSELTAAMALSDHALLFGFTNAVANLQTAQSELADNMLRANATARLAAARQAAHRRPAPPGIGQVDTTPTVGGSVSGGLPTAIVTQHTLPGAAPIDPQTGRPYPVAGSGH
jgi:hypothetical protein